MLQSLKQPPYKNIQIVNLDVERLNVFEIFIRIFIDEVFLIVKHGLKYGYESIEDNVNCFRGKLLVSKNIIHNAAHKERSFVAYDDYNINRPENRLLKTTLLYLNQRTISPKNKRDIRTLLNELADVEPSMDYISDFSKTQPDRNMEDYKRALMWCKVFLQGKSFSSFAGSNVMAALLFPMENIFEAYIASKLTRILDKRIYDVAVQDRKYYLFDWPGTRFLIKPDIVIKNKQNGEIFILDTKWKMLRRDKINYGISQSDMYQMYAYQKKYGAQNVRLIYPMVDSTFAKKR